MYDRKPKNTELDVPVFWGPVSLAIPLVTFVGSILFVATVSRGTGGDMVGAGAIVYGAVALGIGGIAGASAAIWAIKRKESWIALAIIGIILNLPCIWIGAVYGTLILK